MNVIIGVDPHEVTHTAVALDGNELELSEIRVRANASQLKRLLSWAAPFEDRTWAVEGAGGCGYLLSQQLLAVGEAVVDVPATLAARVRVLGSGKSNMVAGGSANKLKANDAERILAEFKATTPVQAARYALAVAHLEDLRRVDAQITESKKRIAEAVATSGTSVTDIVGVGPIVAAMVMGYTGDVRRFATRHRYAAYTGTAPIEMSSGGRVPRAVPGLGVSAR